MNKKLKIAWMIRSASLLNYHRSTLKALKDKGHEVYFIFESGWDKNSEHQDLAKFLDSMKPYNFDYDFAPARKDIWSKYAIIVRKIINYRRFLVLSGVQSAFYLRREFKSLTPFIRNLLSIFGVNLFLKTNLIKKILIAIDRSEPSSNEIRNFLKKINPDIFVISPIHLKKESAEYLKEAIKLKIPNVLSVLSWDNLTTKCYMHIIPDRVLVWNKNQANEAINYQNIPSKRIFISGAVPFDDWLYTPEPTSREKFCTENGLDSQKKIITYLGTSKRLAGDETWLIRDVRKILNQDRMSDVQIIFRPHPGNYDIYQDLKLENFAIVPKKPDVPHTVSSLQLFYDTLFHSEVVLEGVNNSGIIEGILSGKPVIALDTERYRDVQEQTEHFQDLIRGDVIDRAKPKDLPELLRKFFLGIDKKKEKREKFIKDFIWPNGKDKEAGYYAAEQIEKLAVRKLRRMDVIQKVIDKIHARTYLEIGSRSGGSLLPLKVEKKIAVDIDFKIPVIKRILSLKNTKYFKAPSDKYFKNNFQKIDVAFIDGLHTFEQSLKDVKNSLNNLNPGGVIVVHDCNPISEAAAQPDRNGLSGTWNGDVWKTIVALRTRGDLEVFVLDTDQGVGIIRKGKPENILKYSEEQIRKMTYSDLAQNRESFLNLKPSLYFEEFIKKL